jgi:two-component system NtrC family response regulator
MSLPSVQVPQPNEPRLDSSRFEPVIIAESPAMQRAVHTARRLAPLRIPILLVGATGTGKEVLAQAIHRWSGRRGMLVDVDCGAFPPGMAVAELFGHRKGAFTNAVDSIPGLVEQAQHGTLFLDELSSLTSEGQAALIRMLETGEVRRMGDRTKVRVDLRLIAAVQDSVDALRAEGRLREDLYQRLAGAIIRLPPLQARPEDLLPLARHLATQEGRNLSDAVVGLLERYAWPGNVRELRHVIIRAASLTDSRTLDAEAIAEALDVNLVALGSEFCGRPVTPGSALPEELRAFAELCRDHGGRPGPIATALGLSRATLYRKLRRLGLSLRELTGPLPVRLSRDSVRRE